MNEWIPVVQTLQDSLNIHESPIFSQMWHILLSKLAFDQMHPKNIVYHDINRIEEVGSALDDIEMYVAGPPGARFPSEHWIDPNSGPDPCQRCRILLVLGWDTEQYQLNLWWTDGLAYGKYVLALVKPWCRIDPSVHNWPGAVPFKLAMNGPFMSKMSFAGQLGCIYVFNIRNILYNMTCPTDTMYDHYMHKISNIQSTTKRNKVQLQNHQNKETQIGQPDGSPKYDPESESCVFGGGPRMDGQIWRGEQLHAEDRRAPLQPVW